MPLLLLLIKMNKIIWNKSINSLKFQLKFGYSLLTDMNLNDKAFHTSHSGITGYMVPEWNTAVHHKYSHFDARDEENQTDR